MPGEDRSLCDGPLRVCLNWGATNSPSSPTSPSDQPTHHPVSPPDIRQEPPPPVTPMINLAQPTVDPEPVPKPPAWQSDAWQAFGTALKALEVGVARFPPLKDAVSGLLECTMHLKIKEENREEYDRLASDLTSLVQTLKAHIPKSEPGRMPYSIENVSRAINEQIIYINHQQNQSGLTRSIQALDDEAGVIGCYRRIGSIFQQLQTDVTLSVWDVAYEHLMETRLKELNPVHDAKYNAGLPAERHRSGCTPNTRVKILEEAVAWSRKPDSQTIYWMNGMAGTGKTTIAYSLCERLEQSRQLGACFFFSRSSPDCRDVNRVVPTLAYQLARFSNPYQNELCKVLSNNPDVARSGVPVQFEQLIAGPLSKVKAAIPTDVIVVIDALDECSDTHGTQSVLELVFRHAKSLPVKFFVTSRPEPWITSKVFGSEDTYRFVLHLHNVETSLVKEDIRRYLEVELGPINVKTEEIDHLTAQAGCLFIFAATVVRYIEPSDPAADHKKRLVAMLGAQAVVENNAYEQLDEIYSAILSQALLNIKGNEGDTRRLVLEVVIMAREPMTVSTLAELTGLEDEEVQRALLPLRSVLQVTIDAKIVSTLHASFPDFMLSPERSRRFYCDASKQNAYMATRCFAIMKSSLKFNICGLETSSRFDKDVDGLEARVKAAISPGLFYACLYWGSHVHGSESSMTIADMLSDFLHHRLLFWMEVLNLKDCIGHASEILLRGFNALPTNEDGLADLRAMIQDSRNFVTTYAASPRSNITPHIYLSALPLTPTMNRVRRVYWPRAKGLVNIEGNALESRESAALATWATGSAVNKLALSTDGNRVVSGHHGGTVSVWDVSTGRRLRGPLKKHRETVFSVTFSPDGTQLASGSRDGTICISNAHTGETLVGPLKGHTKTVPYLSFSPNGSCLASCSEDHTIRIWDSHTGVPIGTELVGHQDCVMCVVFSSSGERLFSCSDDRTIRVWDWRSGTAISQLTDGHTDWIDCIALSPNEDHIASSSKDCTVRVWSVQTGRTVVGPLTGHTDRVMSVAYSSDGKRIVSGSYDRTIRVWSAENGNMVAGPFTGHSEQVYSVMFSLDGTQIISGSQDNMICVWDANYTTSKTSQETKGQSDCILSVAFSPDGARAALGSLDGTISVWDIHTGNLILGPLKGHTEQAWSVVFALAGGWIVSCSEDCTIRTWDAETGLPLGDPITGHNDGVLTVAVSPDSRLIASGSRDCSVRLWNLPCDGGVREPLTQHTDWVRSVAFSPDGSRLVSGSYDMTICVWDVNANTPILTFNPHTDWVTGVRFTSNGERILSCSCDGKLLLWDTTKSAVGSGPWEAHNNLVWDIAVSPDDTVAASASQDNTIGLWDIRTGALKVPRMKGHTSAVSSVEFSPDGKHVMSGSLDGTMRMWKIESVGNIKGGENSNWVISDDGWLVDSESKPVLWVPLDLRSRFPVAPCSMVIHPHGSIRINVDRVIYGDRWADCYMPSADNHSRSL
ncbi:Vegetative incompatibility protein HET-E-1 OS=Podospora anserina GN=HET-E1 PE=4 SV=1 [Rhizoctonia solani AG-1 IB]|uniref:Vegetative incompatibility protein HET-E-1 n=2 Tax=Rhizoctonia solani TaxID=456999 RepID=M5BNA9_THACB|nr:Vegetative incompatibility protein HET-E-1 [Rhizoctonia solani AG-1 IB]CEL55903.1 Vegetative incompatibility protein HET-E-1 OS=Podospora anserina GN=HET-E1 PE=4 SV=1 [Rhizoctonia solani AG-1 IB]